MPTSFAFLPSKISMVMLVNLNPSGGDILNVQAEAIVREVGKDYHRLSWLTLSVAEGCRLSALPFHFLAPFACLSSTASRSSGN